MKRKLSKVLFLIILSGIILCQTTIELDGKYFFTHVYSGEGRWHDLYLLDFNPDSVTSTPRIYLFQMFEHSTAIFGCNYSDQRSNKNINHRELLERWKYCLEE